MHTNQTWNTPEHIEAIGDLWPLALIVFLGIVWLSVVTFFRPQARAILDRLQNIMIKWGKTEFSVNQDREKLPETKALPAEKEPPVESTKKENIEPKTPAEGMQPELNLDPEAQMYYCALTEDKAGLDEAFRKLQSKTVNDEERIKNEARYLLLSFQNGDQNAQKRLKELEDKARNFPTTTSFVQRQQAQCYSFTGDHLKAVERYQASIQSGLTEESKADGLAGSSNSLYDSGEKIEAIVLLKSSLPAFKSTEARLTLLLCLSGLYEKENDHFGRAIVMEQALQLQPNSTDLIFKAAYSFSHIEFNSLATAHYEKLIHIDSKNADARNNLGVAYANLELQSLAVVQYKRAIDLGETLAAANLAHILMDAGHLDEAAAILKEAQSKKTVHENVNGAVVKLDRIKKQTEETRSKHSALAKQQRQFFLSYGKAFLTTSSQFQLDGSWLDSTGKIIEVAYAQQSQSVEIVWTATSEGPAYFYTPVIKFKFTGKITGLTVAGEASRSEHSNSPLLGKSEPTFQKCGKFFGFFVNSSELHILIQRDKSLESQIVVLTKAP